MEALKGEFILGKQKSRGLKPKVNGPDYRNIIRFGTPDPSPEREKNDRRETETHLKKFQKIL